MNDSSRSSGSTPKIPLWLKYAGGLLGVVFAAGINIAFLISKVGDNGDNNKRQDQSIIRHEQDIQMLDRRLTINETRDMQQEKDLDNLERRLDRLDRVQR